MIFEKFQLLTGAKKEVQKMVFTFSKDLSGIALLRFMVKEAPRGTFSFHQGMLVDTVISVEGWYYVNPSQVVFVDVSSLSAETLKKFSSLLEDGVKEIEIYDSSAYRVNVRNLVFS